MRKLDVAPTGREAKFGEEDIIVSKTDLKGIITYANDVFQKISGYTEQELLGQPHNLIRHPDMPGSVFKLLWDVLEQKREVFAYVLNQAKNGDHYWVFAHVSPTYDTSGNCIGYHSNRRVPYPDALPTVKGLYAAMLAEEKRHANYQEGMNAATQLLVSKLKSAGMSYEAFVFTLSSKTKLSVTPS